MCVCVCMCVFVGYSNHCLYTTTVTDRLHSSYSSYSSSSMTITPWGSSSAIILSSGREGGLRGWENKSWLPWCWALFWATLWAGPAWTSPGLWTLGWFFLWVLGCSWGVRAGFGLPELSLGPIVWSMPWVGDAGRLGLVCGYQKPLVSLSAECLGAICTCERMSDPLQRLSFPEELFIGPREYRNVLLKLFTSVFSLFLPCV